MTHWKSPWCWETLRAGGEGDDNRGWDGWVASLTEWTRVWANSGRWWRTGKPGMLQSTGLQRVRHDSVTEQQQRAGWESVEACRRVSWGLGLDGRVHWFHPHSLARAVSRLPWIIMMETGNCSLLFVLEEESCLVDTQQYSCHNGKICLFPFSCFFFAELIWFKVSMESAFTFRMVWKGGENKGLAFQFVQNLTLTICVRICVPSGRRRAAKIGRRHWA